MMLPRAVSVLAVTTRPGKESLELGGLLYAFGPHVPYGLCACLFATASVLTSTIVPKRRMAGKAPVTAKSIFSGIHYIRERRNILGAISLDLFVVLLGGATALLPGSAPGVAGARGCVRRHCRLASTP